MTGAEETARAKRTEEATGRIMRQVLEIAEGDLEVLAAALERQDTMLPYLDPTSWMRGGGTVTGLALRLTRAFMGFRAELGRIREEAGPHAVRDWLEFATRVEKAREGGGG